MTPLLAALVLALAPTTEALGILERHECQRCHVVEGVKPLPMERDCRGCHVDISTAAARPERDAAGRREFGDLWPTFIERTGRHFVHVPTLKGLDRFKASWLRDFLRAPYDLRPGLDESMIRHAMTPAEIDALVRGVHAQPDEPAAPPADAALRKGAKLYATFACATCHRFGTRPGPAPAPSSLSALAPDLRHTRDRMNRRTLLAWLASPQAMKPDTVMPPVALPPEALETLADFLLHAPADPVPPAPPADRSLVSTTHAPGHAHAPTYEEVERAVFHETCWHCHSDVDPMTGDGEPGNTGGFGFAAAGLSFESFGSLRKGSIGPDGKRRSVLAPVDGGDSILLARLKQRVAENLRDHVPAGHSHGALRTDTIDDTPRGMPLGLPALTPAQLTLVERWLAAGAHGPKHKAPRARPTMGR